VNEIVASSRHVPLAPLLGIRLSAPFVLAPPPEFAGRLRDECLNTHVFETLERARARLASWRQDSNQVRPHSALGDRAPENFAADWRPADYRRFSFDRTRISIATGWLRHDP